MRISPISDGFQVADDFIGDGCMIVFCGGHLWIYTTNRMGELTLGICCIVLN